MENEKVNSFLRMVRSDEYAAEEAAERERHANIEALREANIAKFKEQEFITEATEFLVRKAKTVIAECCSRLYVKALPVDDIDTKSVMNASRRTMLEAMKDIKTLKGVVELLENGSHYIKDMRPLVEAIVDNADVGEMKEFKSKAILTPEEIKLIEDFEASAGSEDYAEEIGKRIVDVYHNEEESSKKRAEELKNITDTLASADVPMAEAVEFGVRTINSGECTLFNAIYKNKSRAILTEAQEVNITDKYASAILCETICVYGLLETVSALGIKTYTEEELNELKREFLLIPV